VQHDATELVDVFFVVGHMRDYQHGRHEEKTFAVADTAGTTTAVSVADRSKI